MSTEKLLLATRNRGKLREQREALAGIDREILDVSAFGDVAPPEETGGSFLENAVLKALYYERATGVPAVGEDSGLEVDALGGEPGIHSARWMGEETPSAVKNARLLERLAGIPPERRAARYVCAVALAEGGAVRFSAVETCEGRIAEAPRGEGGFGYDPIFFHPPLGKTLAEAGAEEKNRVSHRGRAMARLREFLDRPRAKSL